MNNFFEKHGYRLLVIILVIIVGSAVISSLTGCAKVQRDVVIADEVLQAEEQVYNGLYNAETKTIHLQKVSPPARGFRQLKLRKIKEENAKN